MKLVWLILAALNLHAIYRGVVIDNKIRESGFKVPTHLRLITHALHFFCAAVAAWLLVHAFT